MSLERKDIRAKLDADVHAKLKAICDIDDIDMGEFIEAVLLPVINKRVHDAMMLASEMARQGLTGNSRESLGASGK